HSACCQRQLTLITCAYLYSLSWSCVCQFVFLFPCACVSLQAELCVLLWFCSPLDSSFALAPVEVSMLGTFRIASLGNPLHSLTLLRIGSPLQSRRC
uniref:Uncharacterized protein n=1 Tax=Hucho hucho TaxID=62062 RepID=A0A4W5LGF2_9TELE